jgi:hypothetical protein
MAKRIYKSKYTDATFRLDKLIDFICRILLLVKSRWKN